MVIQDNLVESTIDEFHGYEPILLKEAAAEKRIAIIEGKNGITPKIKNRGWGGSGGSGGADAAVKTKPKCNNYQKHHNGVCNKPKTAFADRLNKKGQPNWTKKIQLYVAQHITQKLSETIADGSDNEVEDRQKRRKSKWAKGLSNGEKMFCMALTMEDNYSDVEDADNEEIRNYKQKARRTIKDMKGKWGSTPTPAPSECVTPQAKKKRRLTRFVGTPSWLTFDFKKLKQDMKTNAQRRFSDICVMVIDTKGKGRMLCCLLDTGCLKSIVLKKFTDKKQRSKLGKEDTVCYTTYGGKFVPTETETLPICLIKFREKTSSCGFQGDAQETGGK